MMFRIASLALACVSASTLALAAASDWPQWMGPQRDGVSTETGLLQSWPAGGPKLVRKATGVGGGYSTVAVVGDRIFTSGDLEVDNFVVALNRVDGKRAWSTKLGKAGAPGWGGIAVWRSMGFYTVAPCRIVDTRGAAGARGGPALAAGTSRTFPIAGACDIPATAWGVSLNVTVTEPTVAGHVRIYPGGTPLVTSSSVVFTAGATRANNAVAPLGTAGDLTVFAGLASGTAHLVLDANGYFE